MTARFIIRFVSFGIASFWATAAKADPIITPILVSIFTSIGISTAAGTIGAVAVSVISGIITAAIGIGISLLLAPKPPKPEDGAFVVQQNLPYRTWGVGQTRVAGCRVLDEEFDDYLYIVNALVGHRVSEFVQLYMNDDKVELSGVTSGYTVELPDHRYGNNVIEMDTRYGLDTETAYDLITDGFDGTWGVNNRGDGVASTAAKCQTPKSTNFQKYYPYGQPSISWVLKLALVYDPRDPAQDPDDDSTWLWSDNPVLCIIWFRCFNPLGPLKDYHKIIEPVVDSWIVEADICDELMPLKEGGTEKRYRIGYWSTTESDDGTSLRAMLDVCDGWHIPQPDGTEKILVGKFREPTVILTDADIRGLSLQAGTANKDSANSFKASWTSPAHGYISVDTDPVEWTEDQIARGQRNTAILTLSGVQSVGQSSRILKRAVERAKERDKGTIDLFFSGMNALTERWVGIQSNNFPFLNGRVIENKKPVLDIMTGGCRMDFVGSGAHIDDYNPATDESRIPPVPSRPLSQGPPIPTNVNAIPFLNGSGASQTICLNVIFDTPTKSAGVARTNLDYVVEWRIADIGGGIAGSWSSQTFTNADPTLPRMSLTTNPVPIDTVLDIQVASISAKGTKSDYSVIVQVDTHIAYVAPGPPILSVTGIASAHLHTENTTSPNLDTIQFWRNIHGSSFGTAITIGSPIVALPGSTTDYIDNVIAGDWDYWATSQNLTPVSSLPDGPINIVIIDLMSDDESNTLDDDVGNRLKDDA